VIVGIFLGGLSSRMGSPKALLPTQDGETLFARTVRIATEAGLFPCLVGPRPEIVEAIDTAGLRCIEDAVLGCGPLGGLVSLLRHVRGQRVVALACDMPLVDTATLRALAQATEGAIVAPRRGKYWEPLCALYDAGTVLATAERRLAAGAHGLQGLLDECHARGLEVDERVLHDWDTLADVEATRRTWTTNPS
jgi:molybdenum cofactor guanylyltransferase